MTESLTTSILNPILSPLSTASTSSTSAASNECTNVSRRRLAFRPQSVKVFTKPLRASAAGGGDFAHPGVSALAESAALGEEETRLASPNFHADTISVHNNNNKPHAKARRRLVTNWTFQETLAFYDGLKQHGKEFEAIARFMAKKKFHKDRDQVRNYYYNAFKIWKLKAQMAEADWSGVPRDARELFVVLNGCEWRKKTAGANFDATRFKALIMDGVTSVRVKKKMITVRTPYCPCLLKFFPYDKRNAEIPTHLCVKLTPHRYVDRNYVLTCEQNPLLQLRVNINDKISSVFALLGRKWITPLSRLTNEFGGGQSESEGSGGSTSISSLALRLRVRENVQIHKVQVEVNEDNFPAMSMKKLKRDYDADGSGGHGSGGVDVDLRDRVDTSTTSATVVVENAAQPSTSFSSSADENSNEPQRIYSTGRPSGKPTKDYNLIKIVQSATKNVFDIDEVKLKDGLTRESAGNASFLQLFYLCGMVGEIMLSYELVEPPPNLDLAWRTFLSLVSRDYGELIAKATTVCAQQQRSVGDSSQQQQPLTSSAAAISSSYGGHHRPHILNYANAFVSNSSAVNVVGPRVTTQVASSSATIMPASVNTTEDSNVLKRNAAQYGHASSSLGESNSVNTTHAQQPPPATSTAPLSLGEFLGMNGAGKRRKWKRNVTGELATKSSENGAVLDANLDASQTQPNTKALSVALNVTSEGTTSNVGESNIHRVVDVSGGAVEGALGLSQIVEAENERFLQQLRRHQLSQPTKRAKRQVKVVPNTATKRMPQWSMSSSGGLVGAAVTPLSVTVAVTTSTSTATFAQTSNVVGRDASNVLQFMEDDGNFSFLRANAPPSSIEHDNNNADPVTAYFIAAGGDATQTAYVSYGGSDQTPLILDERQLTSLLYHTQQDVDGCSAPIIAFIPDSGALLGADVSKSSTLLLEDGSHHQPQHLQFSNLTECSADGVLGQSAILLATTQSQQQRPIDFSHLTSTSSVAAACENQSPPSSLRGASSVLQPLGAASVAAAFRSPTKAGYGRRHAPRQYTQLNARNCSNTITARPTNEQHGGGGKQSATNANINSNSKNDEDVIVLGGADGELTRGTTSLGADFSMDSLTFSAFISGNSNGAAAASSSSTYHRSVAAANAPGATSFVVLDASPSSKTLPEDVRNAYEQMLKENSIDYCRNFEQLTRNFDLIHTHNAGGFSAAAARTTKMCNETPAAAGPLVLSGGQTISVGERGAPDEKSRGRGAGERNEDGPDGKYNNGKEVAGIKKSQYRGKSGSSETGHSSSNSTMGKRYV